MASVKFETQYNTAQFHAMRRLANMFPEIRAELLGYVGSKGKRILFDNFLRGRELQYVNSGMVDKLGRRTVNYKVGKRAASVAIRSYPANFFEEGRTLRDGSREQGKFIITRKLKSLMDSKLTGIVDEFDKIYLSRKLARFDK